MFLKSPENLSFLVIARLRFRRVDSLVRARFPGHRRYLAITQERDALRLIDLIYEAASEPSHWWRVAEQLSDLYRSAVSIFLQPTREPESIRLYTARLPGIFADSMVRGFPFDLPWKREFLWRFEGVEQFGSVFPEFELAESEFYRRLMEPSGLAPIWPIVHAVPMRGLLAQFSIFRIDDRPFDPEDLAFGELLVPHFDQACRIYRDLIRLHCERLALSEVADRLTLGVMLLDSHGRPVLTNRSAERILAMEDALRIGPERIHAVDREDDVKLGALLDDLLMRWDDDAPRAGGALPLSRGPDRRPLQVILGRVLTPPGATRVRGAVVSVILVDPDAARVPPVAELATLYGLTSAEAELVQLIAEGGSLEEASRRRGVTMNTSRSQLKRAFEKTGTSRQSELVKLVLGIAPVTSSK